VKASGIFSETEVQASLMNNRGKKVGAIWIEWCRRKVNGY
jgi:hypothetical protein